MKTPGFFIMALLCLLFFNNTIQAQQLKKKVTLKINNATLPQVLQQIQQQYTIRFSYLNNDLPVMNRISAEIKEKPLSEVLDALLANTNVGYLEKNGQVIIKRNLPKSLPKASTLSKLPPATTNPPKAGSKNTSPPAKPDATLKNSGPVVTPKSPTVPTETSTGLPPAATTPEIDSSLIQPNNQVHKINKSALFDEDSTDIKPYHLGVIYPLSNHGTRANQYVNRISAHLLVGTAAGLQGVEFAGFGNLEQKYVRGFQFSGFFNIIGKAARINTSVDSIRRNSLQGGQFAGFLNIAGGNSRGAQFAGFLNVTRNITGVQGAGFLNKAENVQGAQMSGFINKAKYVKGTQLGIINIADSIKGVPIGLFSYVKYGGYRHAEVFTADDFQANLIYKIGVPKFYTLLALGAELDDKKRWRYGAGFGSEWTLYKRLHLNTDIVSYYVIEDSYHNFPDGLFEDYNLNLLNKFRLLGTLQLARHLAIFGGPTFNVMVSQYQEPAAEKVGSTLPQHTIYDHTGLDGTNVKMWIGFNAGLRF